MKNLARSFFKGSIPATVLAIGIANSNVVAETKTLPPQDFSIGYGFVSDESKVGIWSTDETASKNVLPGKGYDLTVEVEGGAISPTGVSFVDREIQEMSETNASGLVSNFLVSIAGRYVGAKPSDAASNPNYKVTIKIDEISIYTAPAQANEDNAISFSEASYGNEQKQEPEQISEGATFGTLTAWRKLLWKPAKQGGQTRSFELIQTGDGNPFAIDGLEIKGSIEVAYEGK